MAYTPVTNIPSSISFFQWSTPTNPNPRLAAPISATDTTITFTSAPLDHTGAVISTDFLMGVKNDLGYVETIRVPAGALSASGTTATGVIRGIRLEGLDWTTGDSSLAAAFDQDAPVFCNITGVYAAMQSAAMNGTIGSTYKLNARNSYTGTNAIHSDRVFADATARDAAITAPQNGDRCYNTATGTFQKYQAGAWADDATGTTPNASDTVAGKVEEATVAEQGTATGTGGTGARLYVACGNLVKTSSGASDENKIAVLNASGQYNAGFIPSSAGALTGEIRMWSTASAPTGWLISDGSAVSRTTYSALFAVIGTTYGVGDGSTTFNLPDFRGRSPIGSGTGDAAHASAHALASKTGDETHLLDSTEIPSHTHTFNIVGNSSQVGFGSNPLGSNQATSTTFTTNATGGGLAHSIMQPVLTVNFIIKY